MTFGTLAAMMISDAILDRPNPWTDLFDPSRKAVTRACGTTSRRTWTIRTT